MKTCRLTNEVIEQLYANWIEFYNKRVDAINYIRGMKLDEWKGEAEAEIKRDRYPRSQVIEWYDDKIAHMTNWMQRGKDGLEESEKDFEKVYQLIKDAVFTEKDIGYLFIYDFYKAEVRKEESNKKNVVSVKFAMYSWDYTYPPFNVEKIQFAAPEVNFTEWEEAD